MAATWLLGVVLSGALTPGAARAAEPGADRPDAEMLLDLDLLRDPELTRRRPLLERMRLLESLRMLETLRFLESPPGADAVSGPPPRPGDLRRETK